MINKELLNRIEEKKKKLDNLRPLPKSALEKLKERLNIELTYNSNAIEGNRLTLRETQLVIQEGITISGKPLQHHLEAINHENALEWIEEIVTKRKKVDEELILLIHEMILKGISEEAGRYRSVRVRITGAKFTPPGPEKIIREIDELSSQYGNRSALIEQAIRDFLATEAKRRRDLQDIEILNRRSDALNREAEDVLSYQVPV